MADLASLQVQLELNQAAFQAGVKQVDSRLKQLDRGVQRTSKSFISMESALGKLKGGLAGVAASMVAAFGVQSIKNAISFGDGLVKVSEKVGVTVEALQELRFGAEQAGVSSNTLDMALQRFARRSGEAANGTGELVKVYQELGIATKDTAGNFKTTEQLLREYADAIKRVEDPQQRLRLAFNGFDSEGAALVNLLKDGSAGLDALAKAAQDAGAVMDRDTAVAAEVLQSRLDAITTSLSTRFKSAVVSATASLAEFFGLYTNATRLQAKIAEIEAEILIVQARADENSGKLGRSANASTVQLRTLKEELAGLQEQLGQFDDSANGNSIGAPAEAAGRSFDALKIKIEDALDPLAKYRRQVKEVEDAVLAGVVPLKDAAHYIAQIAIEAAKATETGEDFADFMDGISASMNAQVVAGQELGSAWEYATAGAEENLKKTKTLADELALGMQRFSQDFASGIVDGLAAGKLAMDDFAKDFLKMIAKIMLNNVVMNFLQAFGGSLAGSSNGFLSSIGNSITSTSRVIGGTTRTQSSMVVGQVKTPTLSAASHSRNGGGVNITVNNSSGAKVETKQRQGPNGTEIEFMIEDAVSRQMGSGAYDKVLQSRYGVARRGY